MPLSSRALFRKCAWDAKMCAFSIEGSRWEGLATPAPRCDVLSFSNKMFVVQKKEDLRRQ